GNGSGSTTPPKSDGGSETTTPPKSDGGGGGSSTTTGELKAKCEGGETQPCSSYLNPVGTEIQLGPYGSVMEANVGKGFENANLAGDTDDTLGICPGFVALFGADEQQSEKLLDTKNLDFTLYTLYRPANMVDGEKYPIITWGNGTCAQPEGYGTLLHYIASHGFFVIAANNRFVGGAVEMLHALDFLFAENERSDSPYYQRLDTDNVASAGHSQGGLGADNAAADARVKTELNFNGINGGLTSKPALAVSGVQDISDPGEQAFLSSTLGYGGAKAAIYFHTVPPNSGDFAPGHLTLMQEPEKVTEFSVAWFKYQLQGDPDGKAYFIGDSCKACKDPNYSFMQSGLM
ncbi:MAG TPA: hypothetical protein VG942_07420, partial [Hyphomonadaceae bacterium]|nr:hypothetical protein [Hyphomonadaceae bacterium]